MSSRMYSSTPISNGDPALGPHREVAIRDIRCAIIIYGGGYHLFILMHLQSRAQKETRSCASQGWVSERGGGQRRPPRLCKEPLDADSIVVPPEARVEFLHARPLAQGNTLLSAQEARAGVCVRITRRKSYVCQ